MKKLNIWIVCLLAAIHTLSAQDYSGRVENNAGEPIEFATVVLLKGEEALVATLTDSLGYFSLPAEAGNYLLSIQNIAYTPMEAELSISADKLDLGIFTMEHSDINLDAVVVTGSYLTREADRFVMQVNDQLPSMMNKDAAEVLQLAPGVWVDDKGVSINGTTGAKVYINDRELRLSASELLNYLRSYRSSDIARVEVIPQAGAEYSADSKGGVVRIVLRKRLENGINGHAATQTSQGKRYENYRPSASIYALVGKWTFNASATGSISPKSSEELTESRRIPNQEEAFFRSKSDIHSKPSFFMGRIGSIYEINDRNSIGAEAELWQRRDKEHSSSEARGIIDGMEINSTSDHKQKDSDRSLAATFNYIHKIDTIGSTLKFIADYTDKGVTGNNDYHSVFKTAHRPIDSVYRNNSSSDYRIFSADLIFNKTLPKNRKFTAGIRYSGNRIANSAYYESLNDTHWKPIDGYSYSLDYTENIGAAYGTFSFKLRSLSILAGLRGEYAHTAGKEDVDKEYIDLFPHLNMTYSFNPMQTFMLIGQYARNIQRPNFWHLNSNRIQYSDYSYMVGNPFLRPTYIDRISLTAVYRYRYVLSIGANMHKDLIREVTKADPIDPKVRYTIPENHYKENHYFIAVSCPHRFTDWLSINANLVGVKQDIRGAKTDKTKSHYLYFINGSATFSLPADIHVELSYSGTSRLYSANSGVEPRHLVHLQVKRKFFRDQISLSVGINNLFDSQSSYFSDMQDYVSDTHSREAWNSRFLKLSLQYSFQSGKAFKKRNIESAASKDKERMDRNPTSTTH